MYNNLFKTINDKITQTQTAQKNNTKATIDQNFNVNVKSKYKVYFENWHTVSCNIRLYMNYVSC